MRRKLWLPALLAGLLIGGLLVGLLRLDTLWKSGPEPETVARSSLLSLREQARLVTFAARFVSVVTTGQSRFGLSAERTLILPGTVRYEIDLSRLGQDDLAWDESASRLIVTLPPVELAGPEIELAAQREIGGDGLLAALTNVEQQLDQVNRQKVQADLLRQAQAAPLLRLARESARRTVERSFAMPLRAAGVEAEVVARFRDEPRADPSQLDRSRRLEEVVGTTS